jgi:transcriptional regulator with XRE-family HTH domain
VESRQDLTIGQRVALCRKAKGMSQEVLAHLLGRSHSWLTKVERGERQLDRMSLIVQIADVLKVDVTEITGVPYGPASGPPAHAAVPAIRRVLIGAGSGGHDLTRPDGVDSLPVLRARMMSANRLRHGAAYDRLGQILPSLLEDVQRAAVTVPDDEREAAQELIVDACHCGRAMLKALGYCDLAWIAVERGRETAERLGDPLVRAASAWNQAEVYLATGAVGKAIELCLAAIGQLDGEGIAESPPTVSLVGMLHLKAAWGDGILGREHEADFHLREAGRLADLVGEGRNDFSTLFGPTNVVLHGVGVAMELGLPAKAIEEARPLNGGAGLAPERKVRLKVDLARAYAHLRRDDEARQLLMEGERVAPALLRAHPLAREIVAGMIQRSPRGISPDLRVLATRVGV